MTTRVIRDERVFEKVIGLVANAGIKVMEPRSALIAKIHAEGELFR
jgi:hypothetical protein